MKTIEAKIERSSENGTYSVYCENELFSGMGDSAEAAMVNLREQMEFFKKTAMEEGFSYPCFLDEAYEIVC